jgi:hypothetical protein
VEVVVDGEVVAIQPAERPIPAAIGRGGVAFDAGADVAANDVIDPAQVQPFDVQRDFLWPKSVATWLILSAVFLLLSVQAVSPTRRWHLRRGRRVGEETAV